MTSSPTPESRRRRHDDRDERDKYDERKRRKHRSKSRSRSPRDSRSERDRSSRNDERSDRYDRQKHRDDRRRDDSERIRESEKKRSSPMKEEDSAKALQEKLQSKQMMEEAQVKIQQKLKAMGKLDVPILPESLGLKSLKPEEASAYIGLTMNKTEQRLAELKNKLKSSSILTTLLPGSISEKIPENEVVKEPTIEEKLPKVEQEEETIIDPRLQLKRPERGRRSTFKFVQPGEYQKQATIQRNIARLHILQAEIGTIANQTGISSAVKLSLVTPDIDQGHSNYFPTIEWWDGHLLSDSTSYSTMPSTELPPEERYPKTITRLIEHPIPLKAPDKPSQSVILKTYLTKKERKKLRRQNRRELQKEQTEKIRLGLEPPPEPKVKMSNLMKVLGNEAIQDPTKMEAQVREAAANRLKKHLKANADRKLTDQEKSEKKKRKLFEDTSLGVHIAIYRVKCLENEKKRWKVETNAKQLTLTGCMIRYSDINVIIVEGGPKQQKFFKNLMMTRLKWQEDEVGKKKTKKQDEEREDDDVPKEMNDCQLIWEGIVNSHAFNDFRTVKLESPKMSREFLEKYGVGHYWDHAYSASMLLTDDVET